MEAHAPAPPLPSAPERLVNIMLSPVKMTLGIDDEESAGISQEHEDYDELKQAGVGCIFGPGTRIPGAAMEILDNLKAVKI